jgi:hypothetical protein
MRWFRSIRVLLLEHVQVEVAGIRELTIGPRNDGAGDTATVALVGGIGTAGLAPLQENRLFACGRMPGMITNGSDGTTVGRWHGRAGSSRKRDSLRTRTFCCGRSSRGRTATAAAAATAATTHTADEGYAPVIVVAGRIQHVVGASARSTQSTGVALVRVQTSRVQARLTDDKAPTRLLPVVHADSASATNEPLHQVACFFCRFVLRVHTRDMRCLARHSIDGPPRPTGIRTQPHVAHGRNEPRRPEAVIVDPFRTRAQAVDTPDLNVDPRKALANHPIVFEGVNVFHVHARLWNGEKDRKVARWTGMRFAVFCGCLVVVCTTVPDTQVKVGSWIGASGNDAKVLRSRFAVHRRTVGDVKAKKSIPQRRRDFFPHESRGFRSHVLPRVSAPQGVTVHGRGWHAVFVEGSRGGWTVVLFGRSVPECQQDRGTSRKAGARQ